MDEVPIKVAVRVRPLVGQERVHDVNTCVYCIPSKPQLVLGKDRGFTFDFVFDPQTTQGDVYEACVEPLVKSCLQGYNATVFAYGQTGSGKTYTMGSQGTGGLADSEYGVIPRAVKQIFQIFEEDEHEVEFEVHVSYIEIYLEELRDLLELETSSKEIHIRENDKGNTVVIGATELLVETIDDVMSCLDTGSAARQTGTTNMNEESSRSHAIFTLNIVQKPISDWKPAEVDSLNKDGGQEETDVDYSEHKYAKFHFVDLAGSERADRTGNVGERFKESVQINSGLLALGNVISSLADPKKKTMHVPYRESKVTRLLKDSLGGNARTVMIACLSPAEPDFTENLNSLKYATRARNIRNKPVINRDSQNTRLMAMQNQILALREELGRRKSSAAPTEVVVDKTQGEVTQQQIQRYRELCQAYIECTVSASSQLRSLYTAGSMNKHQIAKYEEWMTNLERLTTSKTHISHEDMEYVKLIGKLKLENKKYKADLNNDEEIFAKQSCQIDSLRRDIRELEAENKSLVLQLNNLTVSMKRKDDQLFEQQLQVNQNALKEHVARVSRGRANTAPTDANNDDVKGEGRQLHSSPSILSTDKMIQGFRARSQLLSKKYEEEDEVLCELSESSDSEDEQDDTSRELGRTWKIRKNQVLQGQQIVAARPTQLKEDNTGDDVLDELRSSTQVMSKEVHQTEVRLEEAHHKLRDLTINIRQKEKLIQELVKSEQEERKMKEQFSKKVENMKHEVEMARKDFEEAKKALDEMQSRANVETSDKQKVELECKKNLQLMETKLQALKRKQKDSDKVNVYHEEKEKKVKELEIHVDRMRSQQETLNKRLKVESDKKTRLERDMSKHVQRINELEEQANQQQKIIRRKTEQVANAQRRLRGIGKQGSGDKGDEDIDMKKKRQWLDAEVEKVLQQQQAMDTLQEDLNKREEIVKHKEIMLNEKNGLEMKKLRSSQNLSKDILRLSTQMMKVDQEIKEKEECLRVSVEAQHPDDLHGLVQTRDELNKQRILLEDKLKAGELLDPSEEGRLIVLDEGIEALEVAIDYKTDNIQSKERQLRSSNVESNVLKNEIKCLAKEEATNLLERYLDKVIQLRQNERQLQIETNDKEVKINELERIVSDLQRGLQQAVMVAERKVTNLQQKHEQKVQFLMSQLREAEYAGDNEGKESEKDGRTQQLEKDLYYYKKTCRELKKRLREMMSVEIQEYTDSTDIKRDDAVKTRKDYKQSVASSTARSVNTSVKQLTISNTKNILPPVSQASSLQSVAQGSSFTLKQSENLANVDDSIQDSIETGNNPW